ncbi:putative immunity protein [Actinokineospora guangxiensis]|uniref:Immunity protein n=1 Tax=Actinokineospora guangxiensis TaxID=1490288 RepID=A0ABW0EMW9_9PSEU
MTEAQTVDLSMDELREITRYAAACAEPALVLFERVRPDDPRPRTAFAATREFTDGGKRTKAIRDAAWAAQRAYQEARDACLPAAAEAARAAVAVAGAAYLHPLAKATQVLHILGPAAHSALAMELDGTDGQAHLEIARGLATPTVVAVLRRYPPAPDGRGRLGELARVLDGALRHG